MPYKQKTKMSKVNIIILLVSFLKLVKKNPIKDIKFMIKL